MHLFSTIKPNDNYICITYFKNQQFCVVYLLGSYDFRFERRSIFLNRINQLIFVMETRYVFFAIGSEFLNII
jgi:hypothetical protein